MDSVFDELLQPWRLDTWKSDKDWYHHLPSGLERWRPVKVIGSGTFGQVSQEQCIEGSSQNAVRAVKRISKKHAQYSKSSRRELEALITFSQPAYQNHFVRFLGWFEDHAELYISMEFIEHGNLQQYIDQRPFPEPEAALVITQVAQALHHMHQKNFVHRDLKPMNILVSQTGPQWQVKVADFGISKHTDGTAAATNGIGTPGYMAPELFSSSKYTFAVDVWALGAIAFCMRTGFPPFRSNAEACEYRKDRTLFPESALGNSSGLCMSFVLGALMPRPKRRFTVEQVLAHKWLTIHTETKQSPNIPPSTPTVSTWDATPRNSWSNTYGSTSSIHKPVPTVAFESSPQNAGSSRTTLLPMYSPVDLQPRSPVPPTAPAPTKSQAWEVGPPYMQQALVLPHLANAIQPEILPTRTMSSVNSWATAQPEISPADNRSSIASWATAQPEISPANNRSSTASWRTVDSRNSSGMLTNVNPAPFSPPPPLVAPRAAHTPSKAPVNTGSCWGCKTCGKTFMTRENMIAHVQVNYHLPGTEIKVPRIAAPRPVSVWRAGSPSITMPEASDPYLTCMTCRKHFEKREYLMNHINMLGHMPQVQVDPWLTCLACGQAFSMRSQLSEHNVQTGHARSPAPGPGPTRRSEAYIWQDDSQRQRELEKDIEYDCCSSSSSEGEVDPWPTYSQPQAYMPSVPRKFWPPQQPLSIPGHARQHLYY